MMSFDKKHQTFTVSVLFLDDSKGIFQVDKRAKGDALLDQVFDHLEISERDYFGIQCIAPQPGGVVRWLDPNKSFRKQWTTRKTLIGVGADPINSPSVAFEFRVKFYVTDPSRLVEEYTRYQFYLQIKRDILLGRLACPLNTACLLASYTVQAELGDFCINDHGHRYLTGLELVRDQNEEAERRISELHKLHRGQLPADAEYNYLEHAKKLYMYGVDVHKATDSTGKEISLGVTSLGLAVYQNTIRMNVFSWTKMVKISFKRKEFFIQLRKEPSESYDTLLGFGMFSHKKAKALWKSCVEHHSFFRLERPTRPPRFLPLRLGSRFSYSGRTEVQAVQESRLRAKVEKVFQRSPSKRQSTSLASITSPKSNGGGATNTSSGTDNEKSSFLRDSLNKSYRSHSDSHRVTDAPNSLPRKAWEQQSDDDGGGFIGRFPKGFDPPATDNIQIGDSPIHSTYSAPTQRSVTPTRMFSEHENLVEIRLVADDQGRFGFNVRGGVDLNLPVLVSRVAPHTPADRTLPRICEGDEVVMINGRDVCAMMHEQVVALIRASREQNAGELVLTIKPNALVDFTEEEPLYQYVPENESDHPVLNGDALFTQSLLLLSDGLASGALLSQYEQLYRRNSTLAITEARKPEHQNKNRYRDISPYDCTRVVLINADSGDYINANYVNMEIPEVGINRYIATQGPLPHTTTDFWRMVQQESSHLVVMLTTVMERGRPKCHQYWPSLGEDLQMGPDFRVKCLTEVADETGSFVFRELQLCDRITGEVRTVQHMQYLAWPDHGVPSDPEMFLQFTQKMRAMRSTSLLQEIDNSLAKMRLMDDDDDDEDDEVENGGLVRGTADGKGVEENGNAGDSPMDNDMPTSTSIHQFISAANPPIIVHCSAGIGRTGVLILMDTALALIEAKEPVYPLDVVQAMRDQRACMVQNVAQYRFVCECVCVAYDKLTSSKSLADSAEMAVHDEGDGDEANSVTAA